MNDKLYTLKIRQAYPLGMKIHFTKLRIKQWYDFWEGQVYVSFSGGKDSRVLLDIVRSMYPEVPAVFANTGREYKEIYSFVRSIENVIWMKPKMTFAEVLDKYGYPVISKLKARAIRDVRNSTPNMKRLRLEGIKKDGTKAHSSAKLPLKWRYLIDAPFKISEQCCDVLKKEPFRRYEKETGRVGITGMMVEEGGARDQLTSCNSFDQKKPLSSPLLFWSTSDIWEYIRTYNISYSTIYDMGEIRTGCKDCMFGVQLEEKPNRFDRMKKHHPKDYDYCMNKLGMKEVLDWVLRGKQETLF